MNNGMFHHFTIVNIPIANGESKMYLIDCTYRQFFTKSNSFIQRISVMRGPAKGCSIGAYMMMTEERKQIAEKLLTKGYIEATPQNIKEYFDAIIFSGRGYDYYEQQSLDFMNPNDCIPSYSITNYINMLIQNRVIDENSFFRSIENEKKGITTTDIGRRCINKVDTLSRTKISNIFKCWRNKEKENLRG